MRSTALIFLSVGLMMAAQSDKDRIAELQTQHARDQQLIDNLTAKGSANTVAISKLGAAGVRQAAVTEQLTTHSVEVKKATDQIQQAASQIVDSTDQARLELEKLNTQKSLAEFGLIGTFIATIGSIILALITHRRVEVVATRVNGAVDKIAALSELKGRSDAHAEAAAEIAADNARKIAPE